MAKYFKSSLIYFQEPEAVIVKPENEMSSHMTSVTSGLFYARCLTAVVCTKLNNSWCSKVGCKTL